MALSEAPHLTTGRATLAPLFLVSMAAVGYEIALTRYFAVAKWSEYGYWVISIVMVGFALSGVVMALARDAFVRHAGWLLPALPVLLIVAASAGFSLTVSNPFNPLQLQNPATWAPQLTNIALYYACLLPYFFLTGLYVALSFVLHRDEVGRVYGYDLTGAGVGALLVLTLMLLVHPFLLVPVLLVPLAVSAMWRGGARRFGWLLAAVLALGGGEALLLLGAQPAFNDFKAIYAPLNTPDAKILSEQYSWHGLYQLLGDFTERVDTDVSNNAGMLGLPGPPATFGLYRDGNRIASLPEPGALDVGYAGAALDALPYALLHDPRVLLVGASGGFRIAEVLSLGAAHVDALEPEPVLNAALRDGLGPSPGFAGDPRVRVLGESPVAAVEGAAPGTWTLVDISSDFLDQAEANAHAFTVEALAASLRALGPGGLVSIPVSIREFPVYAIRMLGTVRAALLASGAANPAEHVVVYRSAWSVRILLSTTPWDAARIDAVRRWCDERSFDVSFYPGMDVSAARAGLYNDLPAVSFDAGEVESSGPDDAIADEAAAALAGAPTGSSAAFNLAPVTFDRPFFYSVLRLSRLDTILKRVEILPQAEIAPLVNLAVLAQAVVIALLVMLVPAFSPRSIGASGGQVLRACAYFAALGLGFLFIEIFLIEKVAFYLNDRTTAFALVLTAMLIFSGIGSLLSQRFADDPRRGMMLGGAAILAWCVAVYFALGPAMLASLSLPAGVRVVLLLAVIAPVSVALGLPFPLGLARAAGDVGDGFLPWAWALNGAFSVVATPLANLVALEAGYGRVLIVATLLYVVAVVTFPSTRKAVSWQNMSAT